MALFPRVFNAPTRTPHSVCYVVSQYETLRDVLTQALPTASLVSKREDCCGSGNVVVKLQTSMNEYSSSLKVDYIEYSFMEVCSFITTFILPQQSSLLLTDDAVGRAWVSTSHGVSY